MPAAAIFERGSMPAGKSLKLPPEAPLAEMAADAVFVHHDRDGSVVDHVHCPFGSSSRMGTTPSSDAAIVIARRWSSVVQRITEWQ